MLRICLTFWKSEPQCAYKRYAYKKHVPVFGEFWGVKSNKEGDRYFQNISNVGRHATKSNWVGKIEHLTIDPRIKIRNSTQQTLFKIIPRF